MTQTAETSSKKPTHLAYVVRNTGNESYWDRIGVAWANQDGKGFNIQLHSLPLDGRITLRLATEQK
jgi:hypothetical protein